MVARALLSCRGQAIVTLILSPLTLCRESKVVMTAKKDEGASTLEINVMGETMRLGSPNAAAKVGANPFMQEKLLAMQDEINALLGQINVPATASASSASPAAP